jgi:hypothetical protein
MVDSIAKKERPPRCRLEGWLVKKLAGGGLRELPRYYPLGGRGGQCPEQYARALLAALRTADAEDHRHEQLKDDGRAFRSWAESAFAHVAHRAGVVSRGFIIG